MGEAITFTEGVAKIKNRLWVSLVAISYMLIQVAEISRFPLINEDLSMLNSNFSTEPFLDKYFYKKDHPLDVSFANQLPFQVITILCNKLGIYGYDVYLVRYAINFLVIFFLLVYLYSKTFNLNYYVGIFAGLCVATTLIFDQVMLYTPRLSALVIICSIFLLNYKKVVSQDMTNNLRIILSIFVLIYSFGLFANIGNAITVITPFLFFSYLKYRYRLTFTWKNICGPYFLLIPSFCVSLFLVWSQAKIFNLDSEELVFFKTTSAIELIQGRGAWWEAGYLPWSSSLDNSFLVSFRFALFSIIVISFIISLVSLFLKKGLFSKNYIFSGNQLITVYGIMFLLVLIFPSKELTEFSDIFYAFREPWSKFGPVLILFYGYSISISMRNLLSFMSRYYSSHFNKIMINIVYSIILFTATVIIVPDRTPKNRFSSDIDFAVTSEYAKYISKTTLKINSLLTLDDTEYNYCLVPSGDLFSDLTAGRWFFAYSKNIKHYVEFSNKAMFLGGQPYSQLGSLVNHCPSRAENADEGSNFVRICLPSSVHSPLKKCDFKIKGIPRYIF